MLFKTSSVLLLAIVGGAGCAEVCSDGAGAEINVMEGEIRIRGHDGIATTNTSLGTLTAPDERLARCVNLGALRFFGPFEGPLTPFDHVENLGLLEFRWMDVEEIDAFPSLASLGDLRFQGFFGDAPDPDDADDEFPENVEEMRVARVGGFPKLEFLRSVSTVGAATIGGFVGFGSLVRIDSFDFELGISASTFEGFSTVESMGEFKILGSRAESLADLRSLRTIDGDLSVASMSGLRTLGFDALESVGGDLSLQGLGVRSWNGLGQLSTVGGDLSIVSVSCVPADQLESWLELVTVGGQYDLYGNSDSLESENCTD
jgi:hypothetical protein